MCDGTAVLTKYGSDSTSNPLILPLVGYSLDDTTDLLSAHIVFFRSIEQING